MKFTGIITKLMPVQTGTSKTGKEWRKQEAVLEYDGGQYPKSIVFGMMNDNVEKIALQEGGQYELDIDFSTNEYNGKVYMSATCWRAKSLTEQEHPGQQPAPAQKAQAKPAHQAPAQPASDDDIPF